MIDQVAADRIMSSGRESDFQFRAHTVGRGDEHRLPHVWKSAVEHAAKAADFRQRARVEGRAGEPLDSFSRAIGSVDVYARVGVSRWFRHRNVSPPGHKGTKVFKKSFSVLVSLWLQA